MTFFQAVCKLCIEYFCSSCKFEIPVRSCCSLRNSFPNSYYKVNLRKKPNCQLAIRQSFFYASRDVRWLGSRVVSVLMDSGAEGPGFKSQPRRCRVTVLGKLFTPIVPLLPSSKIGSNPLKGCGVTAGLAESNGSLPPGL